MSCWSPNVHQSRPLTCPEGSHDFQKVLDELLTPRDDQCAGPVALSGGHVWSSHVWSSNEAGDLCVQEHAHSDWNNNREKTCAGDVTLCTCESQLSTHDSTHFDGFLTRLTSSNSTRDFRLPQLAQNFPEMGTSCSSNFYDSRDWKNVADGCPTDHLKNGRRGRVSKKQLALYNQQECLDTAPPATCTCSINTIHRSGHNTKVTSDKPSPLTSPDMTDPSRHQRACHWMSSSGDSSGHIKLSRAVVSGRSRASSSCDVSPHRLLTRRVNSPSPRTTSLDGGVAYSTLDAMRQRSHSWSNGKLGSRSSYLRSAPMVRSSLSPIGQRKFTTPSPSLNRHKESTTTVRTAAPKQPRDLHGPDCPLSGQCNDVNRTESSVSFDDSDSCLSPVLRHRSASESHTTRPRRLLAHADSGLNGQEHVHVRWADEEKGSSLSTSVFLTSIRPRSYSYGSADGPPQRPILKKVAGL